MQGLATKIWEHPGRYLSLQIARPYEANLQRDDTIWSAVPPCQLLIRNTDETQPPVRPSGDVKFRHLLPTKEFKSRPSSKYFQGLLVNVHILLNTPSSRLPPPSSGRERLGHKRLVSTKRFC